MRKLYLMLLALCFAAMTNAQISVTVTGNTNTTPNLLATYPSLSAALTDLNLVSAMTGPVVLTCDAGTSETAPVKGFVLGSATLNPALSSSNTITINKSGGTVTINAGVGTSIGPSLTPDGMLYLNGADYVTIDGLTFTDGNTTNATVAMEFGIALFKRAAADGCNNNTIQNCTFNMQRLNNVSGSGPLVEGSVGIGVYNSTAVAATTALTPTNGGTLATNGTNSANRFYSNSFNGGNYGIALNGYLATTGVGPSPTATTFLGDMSNDIGGSSGSTGNTILNYGGATSATNPAAGIRANNQWSINISYNTINNNNGSGVNHPITLRGIYAQAGTSANANINYNDITIKGGATTSTVTAIENAIGSTSLSNTVNINNNTITGEYLTATSGAFYGIYNSSSATTVNVNDNSVNGWNYSSSALTGSGSVYPIYLAGAGTDRTANNNTVNSITRTGTTGGTTIGIYISAGTNQTTNGNTVTNMSIDGTGTASTMYGIQTTTGTVVVNSNQINNLSCIKTTGTSALYGIYNIASPTNENYNNNTIHSLTHNGASTAVYGIYINSVTGTRTMSGNTVHTLSTAGLTIAGINNISSSPNVFKNKVYGITSTSTGAPLVSGIIQGSLGTSGTANIYNNLIGNLTAPNASGTEVIRGLNITTTTTSSSVNVSFNTIYINASSTGANFGTTGIWQTASSTATTGSLTLKNNIIVNNSTANGTGMVVAFRRNDGTAGMLANYNSASNNNLFYAGTPGATNVIYFDGTSTGQTITDYKTGVFTAGTIAPRDAASFTENPTFQSTTGSSANFLKIDLATSTQIESGGIPVTGITDDYWGTTRNVTTPDVGAFEGAMTGLDLTGPSISYTALSNTCGTGSRTLTASISDASGVPTAGIGLPVLYWRINAGAWSAATGTYVSGSNYDFTFGSGVVALDVVQYYIVAQDNAGTPNVSAYPSGGAGGFSINPPAASTAPTTPSSYNIQTTLAAGTYTVGTSGTYTTLTAAVAAYNTSCLGGPIVFELLDATYTSRPSGPGETFPITINANADASATNTLTIRPATGVSASISNSSSSSIFKLDGADWVTINGSNSGGSSRDLTIENTSTSASSAVVWVASASASDGATNNTVKNCIITGNATTTTLMGIFQGGTASISTTGSALTNNSSNTYQNNRITTVQYGVFARGVNATTLGTGLQIKQNAIGTSANGFGYTGIIVQYQSTALIESNEIQNQVQASLSNSGGIIILDNQNSTLSKNNIHNLNYTGSSTGKIVGIHTSSATYNTVGSPSNLTIFNNIIYDIESSATSTSWNTSGISNGGGYGDKYYFNSVYLTGSLSGSTGTGGSACFANGNGLTSTNADVLDIRNNVFAMTGTSGAAASLYAHYTTRTSLTGFTMDNNSLYFSVTGSATGYTGRYNSINYSTLANWQTATGLEAASISSDPLLNSPTNLVPLIGSPLIGAGVTGTGITTDILGTLRNSPPTIGAYENAGDGSGPTITYTNFSNTLCTTDRTLSATITDASGVNTTSGTKPRLYFKKSTDANNYVGNTSGDNGWKWVEASNASSPFSFTTDYSLLQSAVASGDIIQYFVVAQDLAGTPNVSINSGVFAATPSSVALTGSAFPIGGTINSYTINSGGLSGTVNVGPGETYETLSAASGLFAIINAGGLTGNLTAEITGNITTEDGSVALNQINYGCTPPYTLTIKPAASTTPTISGLSSGAIIKLNGADYVTIDGSNSGGSSKDMTISNLMTSATNSVIWLGSSGTGLGATNNTIKNCNISNASLTVVNYGIAVSDGTTIGNGGADNDNVTIQNNSISYCATGIYANGSAAVSTGGMDNLTVSSNSITTNCSVASIGIRVGNALSATISQNTLDIQQSVSNAPVGISLETGVSNTTVSRNKITRVKYTGTTGYGGRGITVGTGSGSSNITISNNVIYGVAGDNWSTFGGSSSAGIMIGVIGNSTTLTTTAGGINLYYNSVNMYDSYSRSATACITTALYVGSGASALDIRNNVFVNSMENTGGGTGSGSKAYAVYSAVANTAFTTMNYNDYYVSGAQGMLGFLGTDQANLAAWQTATAQDVNSISSDPLFNANTNLIPQSGSPLLAAATPIGTVTIDYTGASRSGTTPTIGAYEVAGDFVAPVITYTALANTLCLTDRTLSATITDASGVNTTSGTKPRLYFKKSTDANNYVGNTSGDNGWKWVEASNASSPFSFTTSYSLLQSAVASGDIIQYFVVAQDLAGTPYVGINSGVFAATPSSVALTSAAFPITGTINSYNLTSGGLSGTVTIGALGTYPTLTDAGGLFAYINSSGLTGNLTVNIIDASVTETGLNALNAVNYDCFGPYTITIKPDAGVTTILTGSIASNALIKLNGASKVTIDGSNSGTSSRDMTITNTSATSPKVVAITSTGTTAVSDNTLKNTIIINGATSSSAVLVSDGATLGNPGYFNNITISNNSIQKAYMGVYCNAVASGTNGSGLTIELNDLNTTGANSIRYVGLYVQGVNGAVVQNNTIANFDGATSENDKGIWIAAGSTNSTVVKNKITNLVYTGTSGYSGQGIYVSTSTTASNTLVANNFIAELSGDGWDFTTTPTDNPIGIALVGTQSGVNVYNNSINLTGNTLNKSNAMSMGIYLGAGSVGNIRNNIIVNNLGLLAATGYGSTAVYAVTDNTQFTAINYNDYYVNATGTGINAIGQISGTSSTTLAAWQTATGQDGNSKNVAPVFTSSTDLHLSNAAGVNCQLDGWGTPIASVTVDIDNASRDAAAPDMGADEFTSVPASTTLAGTTGGAQVCTNSVVSGAGTIYKDASCNAIASVLPNGGSPVSGMVNSCVKIDATVQTYGGSAYVQRHFDIEPATSASTATGRVTLYVLQSEFDSYNAANGAEPDLPTGSGDAAGIANLRVTQFHGTGTAPGTYTGSAVLIDPVDGDIVWDAINSWWTISFNVTGFSGFYIHSDIGKALPVNIISFSGYKSGSVNKLQWTTSSEQNNMGFDVQRSLNGINYTSIGFVNSLALGGNSATSLNYNFTDNTVAGDKQYYRLRQVDMDNHSRFSNVVFIKGDKPTTLTIGGLFPNPANSVVNVLIAAPGTDRVTVLVTDIAGRTVAKQLVNVETGNNTIPVDISGLSNGTYMVKLVCSNNCETAVGKFVKQ